VYVTHDQEEALTMSDRIGVMNAGRLLQVGAPEQIYETPANRFVADFIGETNFIDGTVAAPGEVTLPDGTLVRAHTRSAAGTAVTLTLRPEKIQLWPEATDPGESNRLSGTVKRRMYFGDSLYYEVDFGFAVVDARQENAPGVHRFEEGERVLATFDPSAAEALTE
jgi:spermidine/putrescine transport system ATP-binding protein